MTFKGLLTLQDEPYSKPLSIVPNLSFAVARYITQTDPMATATNA
jgi:hypothetical protein